MSEAWEDILLEMDCKLKKLAEDKYVNFTDYLLCCVTKSSLKKKRILSYKWTSSSVSASEMTYICRVGH